MHYIDKQNISENVSTKMLSRTTVFSIDNNNKCLFEQKISMLEWFLKDYVTLKTGVMMMENNSCFKLQ